jgi:glucosamine--fructose-6-phosphate aminotransferase (isomerizing)
LRRRKGKVCGIVGYVGKKKNAVSVLLDGLQRLEYRGYDSAGVAVISGEKIEVTKRKGFISDLKNEAHNLRCEGGVGIGHTRWATHGPPSQKNAHPHLDCRGEIALVHNGIIENYLQLKEELLKKGHKFTSETDTEVISHLIEEYYNGDLLKAVRNAVNFLDGSFAIAVISSQEPGVLVAARKDSPLVLGIGKEEFILASDIPALLPYTRQVIILENGEIAKVDKSSYEIFSFEGEEKRKEIFEVTWDTEAAEKGGYEDFMLKEIFEQPRAVKETIRGRIDSDGNIRIKLGLSAEEVRSIQKVILVACGTSYYAGLVGKNLIERWAEIPSEVEISSEFRYREPIFSRETLVVAITQSGETADTLAGLRLAQSAGANVIAVTNVVGSTASREADGVIYTHAGPEIGVAATKTLTSQMAALYLFALYLAERKGTLKKEEIKKFARELLNTPALIEKVLNKSNEIKALSQKFCSYENFLYLGRSLGVPVALEGALKLKEISYIHAEGYPAGEMKHGPIALIDEKMPVVVIATGGRTYEKILGNIEEVKARKGIVIAIATEGDEKIEKIADYVFYIPSVSEEIMPLLSVVPLQLFAYYIAKERGCNVDQPRNLAKSVTVE